MSLEPGHVYLMNRHHTDLLVHLNHRRDVSPGTLRRGSTVLMTTILKRSSMTDMTKVLELDRDTTLWVLKTSPDLTRWRDFVDVVDVDANVVDVTANTVLKTSLRMAQILQDPSASVVDVEPIVEAAVIEPTSTIEHPLGAPDIYPEPVQPPTLDAPKAANPALLRAEATAARQAAQLENGEDPNSPSITWKREKLAEYALGLGLKVHETETKASVLRKIRSHQK